MPVPLRTPISKAEAKYNVITEFPKLGLHEAAASGNLGLVEYALDHGQPVNSVLDGVLPLHAACAGGHIQVVRVLIEHGADVNAPRLPRRYFNDKNRDASAPIVGTSLSTPLHFAAANGNTEVVTLLLHHGAQAERADKYGVTPEKLAHDNNWIECAQVLREWVINKDRDLREREEMLSRDGAGAASASSSNVNQVFSMESEPPSTRRRLHVKHSIDTALNILKSSHPEHCSRPNHPAQSTSPPSSPFKPFGDYSFDPDANGNSSPVDQQTRRPSLPHISPSTPTELSRRKATAPLPSPMQRRPRSAGTGADRSREPENVHLPFGRGGQGRKLASKISLLFKKGADSPSEHQNDAHSAPITNSPTPASASTSTLPLASTPSSRGRPSALNAGSSDQSPTRRRNHASSDASSRSYKITPQPMQLQPPSASFLDLDNSAPPSPAMRPPLPSAVDLHNALAQHGRDRSRSNATNISTVSGSDYSSGEISPPLYGSFPRPSLLLAQGVRNRSDSASSRLVEGEMTHFNDSTDQLSAIDDGKGTVRPGILRGHHRTGSSGQASTPVRALRFDSTSSGDRTRRDQSLTGSPASIHLRLHPTASSSSLRNRVDIATSTDTSRDLSPPPSTRRYARHLDEEDEEQDYGQQLPASRLAPVIDEDGEELHPPSALFSRDRGTSFGSSSDASLSPVLLQQGGCTDARQPSRSYISSSVSTSSQSMESKPTTHSDDKLAVPDPGRGRGDSLSSTSTADSGTGSQFGTTSSSNGSGSGTSVTVLTPAADSIPLPSASQVLEGHKGLHETIAERDTRKPNGLLDIPSPPQLRTQTSSSQSTLNERRAHSPLDIEIAHISSHAQAEALVEKTRQDILELASSQDPKAGPTPLSARLAALGESLALERKLREQEKLLVGSNESLQVPKPSPLGQSFDNLTPIDRRHGVERQHSLETKARPKTRVKAKDPRRPSTADGLSTRNLSGSSFFPGEHSRHQTSLSVSPPNIAQTSTSFDRRDFFSAPNQRSAINPSPVPNQPSYEPATAPPVLKTRIQKQLDVDGDSLSRVSSAECADTETESTGPGLAPRLPATPASARKKDTIRSSSSAKKLTRMGFSATDNTLARSTQQQQQPNTKLFGGFKSIMQTLKGKS